MPPEFRTDQNGRAYAGGRLQLQIYVNRRTPDLTRQVLNVLGTSPSRAAIRWLAPLEREDFRDHPTPGFMSRLELGAREEALAGWWPSGQSLWDGLGILQRANRPPSCLLACGWSHPGELYSPSPEMTPCAAAAATSAIAESREWFGVGDNPEWEERLWGYASRLAHVYFLHEHCGRDAWLVNLCFTDDRTRIPTTEREWSTRLAVANRELGFGRLVPWVIDVFLPALPRSILVNGGA